MFFFIQKKIERKKCDDKIIHQQFYACDSIKNAKPIGIPDFIKCLHCKHTQIHSVEM